MAGKKVLVADDSLTIQKVIRLALSNEGYDIQAISDGNDALQQIAVFRPHVVLIDVSLPGKTAFEVKREVNRIEDASNVKFILMSSAFERIDEAQAAEVHFDGKLTKPFDPAHLRQVLTDVLSQSAPESLAPPPALPAAPELPPAVPYQELELTPPPPLGLEAPNDPDFPPSEPPTEKDDIRQLTESTIRMSGLDRIDHMDQLKKIDPLETLAPPEPDNDFNWSVQEPSLRPPSGLTDHGGSTFDLLPPVPREPERERPSHEPASADLPPLTPLGQAPQTSHAPQAPQAPSADVEELVRREVSRELQKALQGTLEKMAQKILPEVAERVIKAEIHRLLSEQP